MLRVRNKGTVERINIPPDKLEEAKKILNSDYVADAVKRELMRKLANGRCVCDNIAIHKVIFDISDEKQAAKKVERYCEACLKTVTKMTK